jgi:hypothetical protein
MSLPKEIYVWDESSPGRSGVKNPIELNLERDGSRPNPDPTAKEPIRAGVYQLVREVEIYQEIKEVPIKSAIDLEVDSWSPSSWRKV